MVGYTEDRRGAIIGLQVLFAFFSLLFYSLRAYTRLFLVRSFGVDDYLMGLAVLLSIGISITDGIGTNYGWGVHMKEIVAMGSFDYEHVTLISWISEVLFTICTSAIKASILYFYLRLVSTGTYRKVVWGSIAFIAVWLVTFTSVVVFQCNPVSAYWKSFMNDKSKCFAADIPLLIHGMTNSLTDLYVFVLPMPMFWKVQLPKKQRIGLMALFGIGFITVGAGAVRLYYSILTAQSADYTWMGYYLWTWEAIEINLGIICACIPGIKPLIVRILPSLLSYGNGSSVLPSNRKSFSLPIQTNGTKSRTLRNSRAPFDGSKSYVMGTITTATTGKTKLGSIGHIAKGNESEENLTAVDRPDVILQVTSFESHSHSRTDSEMEMGNIGVAVPQERRGEV